VVNILNRQARRACSAHRIAHGRERDCGRARAIRIERELQAGVATNLKLTQITPPLIGFLRKWKDPYWILDTVEFKTAWHPIEFDP